MELRQLRHFLAVASSLNFRQASAALFVEPGQLSRSIRTLEVELGVRLFERTTRRVDLTDAGRRLIPRAQDLVGRADSIMDDLRRPNGASDRFVVGVRTLPDVVLRTFEHVVAAAASDVELNYLPSKSPQQTESVLRGDMDFGFVAGPVDDLRIGSLRAVEETMAIAVPDTPEFRELEKIRPIDLAHLSSASDGDLFIDGNMARYVRASHADFRVDSGAPGAMRALVATGRYWAFTFLDGESAWNRTFSGQGVLIKPTEDDLHYATNLIWSNIRERSSVFEGIIAGARAAFPVDRCSDVSRSTHC